MEDIDTMMKCRAIFLYDIALLCDDIEMLKDERIDYLLHGFMKNYLKDNFQIFNLIYYFKKDNNGNLCIYEENEWQELLFKYLGYFSNNNDLMIRKIFNDVGGNIVNEINKLAELFYEYVFVLRDMRLVKIKS